MLTVAPPKVELKVQPILKSIVYSALAAEMVRNTGMTDDDQINAIAQAVSEGLVEKVIVTARHPSGKVHTFTLAMKAPAPGETLDLALVQGRSMLETVDVGLAAGVKSAADLITRQGLKPEFRVAWSAKVRSNPTLGSNAVKRLNLRADPVPELPPPPPPLPAPVYTPIYEPPRIPAPPPRPQRYPQTVHTYTTPPPLPPRHVYKPVTVITPAADKGLTFSHVMSVLDDSTA